METTIGCLLAVLLFVVIYAVSFLATTGIIWLICWAFGVAFIGWKICFGIWLALMLISWAVKSNVNVKK